MKVTATTTFVTNRAKFLKHIDTKRKRILALTGGFGRRAIQRKIRKRKSSSKPGKPPTNRKGLLKDHVGFNVFDDSVLIGPEKLRYRKDKFLRGGVESVPELLEKGGAEELVFPDGNSVVAQYEPRPYVEPTFDVTFEKLQENIEKIGVT